MDSDEREEVMAFFQVDENEVKAKCKLCFGSFEYDDGAALVLHIEYNHENEWTKHKKNKDLLRTFFELEDDETAECKLCERTFEIKEGDYSVLEIHMSNKHEEEWAAYQAKHGETQEIHQSSGTHTLLKMQETLDSLVQEVSALRQEQCQINQKLRKCSETLEDKRDDLSDNEEPPKKKLHQFSGEVEYFKSAKDRSMPIRSSLTLSDNPAYMQKQNEERQYHQKIIRRVIDNLVRNIKEILPQHGNDTAISSFMRSLKDISGELKPEDRIYLNDSTVFGIVAKYAAEKDLHEVPKYALGFLKDCTESHSSLIDSFLLGGVLTSLRITFMRHWTNGEGSTPEIALILQIYGNIVHGIDGRRDDIITMLGAAAEQTKNVALDLKHQLFSTLCFLLDAEIGEEAPSKKLQSLVDLIEKEVKKWRMEFLTGVEMTNIAMFVNLCSTSKVPALCYFAVWTLAAVTRIDEKRNKNRFELQTEDRVTLMIVRSKPGLADNTKSLLDKVLKF